MLTPEQQARLHDGLVKRGWRLTPVGNDCMRYDPPEHAAHKSWNATCADFNEAAADILKISRYV